MNHVDQIKKGYILISDLHKYKQNDWPNEYGFMKSTDLKPIKFLK